MDAKRTIKDLHRKGFDYFLAVPVKGKGVKIWVGRTERESPTRH